MEPHTPPSSFPWTPPIPQEMNQDEILGIDYLALVDLGTCYYSLPVFGSARLVRCSERAKEASLLVHCALDAFAEFLEL